MSEYIFWAQLCFEVTGLAKTEEMGSGVEFVFMSTSVSGIRSRKLNSISNTIQGTQPDPVFTFFHQMGNFWYY